MLNLASPSITRGDEHMSDLLGTTVDTTVVRVVDGDTVAVTIADREEKLRLSNLDTEESNHGSDKPITPWGKKAKERATELLAAGAPVTLEFAGNEPLEVCLERYRDNFGRLLVWLHHDGRDFQERMIADGYSPYFSKYGYADFEPTTTATWPPSATPRRPMSASGTRSGSTGPSSATTPCWGCGGPCGPS
jgi:endonuclease YncB( thermonuclease family)